MKNSNILKILSFVFIVFSFLFLSNISFALTEDELKCSSSTTTVISACGDGSTCTSGKCADGTSCVGSCPIGSTCSFLPKCITGCKTGCQIGYYLSDGDGDHTNNCLEDNGTRCTKSNIKGICEICPPGFYCKGGMKDKIPCPIGKYIDKPGSTTVSDCVTPSAGYCTAKAKLVGTGTITIPSVCIERPDGTLSDTTSEIDTAGDVDISGGVNSQMANDEGIRGYTLGNKLGSNISIPCPVGTYSTSGGACKIPTQGYCASYDGVNCACSDGVGGGKTKPAGSDINVAILASRCITEAKPLLGATSQALCPVGTYDLRTAVGGDYAKPSPFCIYPDSGMKTNKTTTGSDNQTNCLAGTYDSRSTYNANKTFSPYVTSPADKPQHVCTSCPTGTYQDETGKTLCKYPNNGYRANSISSETECLAGTYDNRGGNNQIPQNICYTCPAGYYCQNNGTYLPVICPGNNKYCPAGSISPSTCSSGTYQDEAGASGCKGCIYGAWTNISCQSNNVWYATRIPSSGLGFSTCNSTNNYNNGACTYCATIAGNCGAGWSCGCYCADYCGDGCGSKWVGCERGCTTCYKVCSVFNTCP